MQTPAVLSGAHAVPDEARHSVSRLARRVLGPRPFLLASFALVVVALLGAFAYVVTDYQSQSREQAEARFDAEASIAGQLTAALINTSVSSAQTTAVKEFGGAAIDQKKLDKVAKGTGVLWARVLDGNGKAIASSQGAPAAGVGAGDEQGSHVRAALAGQPTLSDLLPAGKPGTWELQWAFPYQTAQGRRVFVEAVTAPTLSTVLSGYLGRARTSSGEAVFLLDSANRIVAAAGATSTKPGTRPRAAGLVAGLEAKPAGTYPYRGSRRYYSSAPVAGSTWRAVLAVRTSALYPRLAGSGGWLLYAELVAFALAGLLSLLLFRRAVGRGVELARVNAELMAVNTTLEQRVAERTAAAEERAKELARSNEELEQFSAVASHDLQEPLRKIRMFGDRLRERLGGSLSEEPADDLARMESAAERMQRLINDLLDYSRVTHRGKEFERTDLARVAREVVADLEARVVELDATIDVGELPVIDADPTQMRQLLQNLLGNALKFHREGVPPVVRIRSEVASGHPPRFPGESAAADRCTITIEDNGIGFDEKHAERVFTAFERLHSRSAYDGTGIGLSIARKIAWRHGGHITATGEAGKGATFVVTLPIRQPRRREGEGT